MSDTAMIDRIADCLVEDHMDLMAENKKLRDRYNRVMEMLRDKDDRYGIGSMCSAWVGWEIADDIELRLIEEGLL